MPLLNGALERRLGQPLQVAVDGQNDGRALLVGPLGSGPKRDRLAESVNFLHQQARLAGEDAVELVLEPGQALFIAANQADHLRCHRALDVPPRRGLADLHSVQRFGMDLRAECIGQAIGNQRIVAAARVSLRCQG